MFNALINLKPKRFIFFAVLLALTTLVLSGCALDGQTALNILDYRLRKAFPPVVIGPEPQPGSISGVISDETGQPVHDAVALVSTARGEVFQAHSDTEGNYRIDGIKPGRYTPLAAAWGYMEVVRPAVQVQADQGTKGIDFVLPGYQPEPVEPVDVQIGQPVESFSEFPEPAVAARYPFTFTLDGLTINGGQIYLPAESDAGAANLPTLVITFPSTPLNWDAASVTLTQGGYAVLALGVDSDRGLDIEGHVRDFRAALQLWQQGRLEPLGQPNEDWIAASGSFGSLILFRALRDLETMPPAILNIGGVSDAFLGVQALYSDDEALAIPPPYDMAVAAMGRPDRDPAFFYAYSPVYYAERLPYTFIIHNTNDEVIPYNQAERLSAAMSAADAPHELLLYEDTTHYLDPRTPTEATVMVFEAVASFMDQVFGNGS